MTVTCGKDFIQQAVRARVENDIHGYGRRCWQGFYQGARGHDRISSSESKWGEDPIHLCIVQAYVRCVMST
jgi:hypothetical protein